MMETIEIMMGVQVFVRLNKDMIVKEIYVFVCHSLKWSHSNYLKKTITFTIIRDL